MKKPELMEITPDEMNALLQRVEAGALQEGDFETIKAMAETIIFLSEICDQKAASIKRLLKMLFGAKTEKTSKITPEKGNGQDDKDAKEGRKKRKGHGRNPASSYTGAEKVKVEIESLKAGDNCPLCLKGKVYRKEPKVKVRVTGTPPLMAKVIELESLRCNLCGEVFTAEAPENIGDEKYDAASGSMIALLKYGSGLPFNRLQHLQGHLGVPLPASTQWDIVERAADRIYPAYYGLIRQAAQGEVLHNDDTTIKILELINNGADEETGRTGMFTSSIVSIHEEHRIALFFTGRNHAGENMANVLSERKSELSAPIQMCDALSRNVPAAHKIILAHCMAHGRRKFVDVAENYPDPCLHVLQELEKIYKNDDLARQAGMTPDQRLVFHQTHSGPTMDKLHVWLNDQIDGKKVEPNSGLGQAISYMLKHWDKLTLFLRVANAPLDNNICERALKKAILHRKNALFFKTLHGAFVGDLFMSLIYTCNLNGANPFDYLTALQKFSSEIFKDPSKWFPWNYEEMIPSCK